MLKQYQRLFYWIILDANMPVNFFSLSTGEQEGVVVVVGGGGGGGVPLCPLHALQVSFATTSVASLPVCVCVCVFFLGGGGGGGGLVGSGGWWNRKGN